MKTIIAGSRCKDVQEAFVSESITASGFSISLVVCGMCPSGGDFWGFRWADNNNVAIARFYPDWKANGNTAGMIRNKEMGDFADALIAFWDGNSKGTKHMIEYMRGLNKPIFVVRIDGLVEQEDDPDVITLEF